MQVNQVSSEQFPSIIDLNVGGQLYTTSLSILVKDPKSLLGAMFSGRQRIARDARGRYFIDRDGALFRYVLDYLRNSKLCLPEEFIERERLLCEAEYYKIEGLIEALREKTNIGRQKGILSLSYRGTYAFGRDGLADVKFRKIHRILVCGNVTLTREVFEDTLNETRDPDRSDNSYSSRFYLKHGHLEKAFDLLADKGFDLIASHAGGAGHDGESDETKWNHFIEYIFQRK